MNNWRESRFKAVCRVFSFCCVPTGPLVVIKGRMAVCGDAWSRTTLLKNQLLSFAKLSFALYPCRARHPRLSRPPSQAASTFFQTQIWLKLKMKKSFLPTLGFFVFFYYNKQKKYVIIILYPSFLDKQYVVDLPVSGKPHKQAHINVQQHQGCNL